VLGPGADRPHAVGEPYKRPWREELVGRLPEPDRAVGEPGTLTSRLVEAWVDRRSAALGAPGLRSVVPSDRTDGVLVRAVSGRHQWVVRGSGDAAGVGTQRVDHHCHHCAPRQARRVAPTDCDRPEPRAALPADARSACHPPSLRSLPTGGSCRCWLPFVARAGAGVWRGSHARPMATGPGAPDHTARRSATTELLPLPSSTWLPSLPTAGSPGLFLSIIGPIRTSDTI